jgi:hypothetical protein
MGESQMMHQSLERLRQNATKCRDLASTAMTPAARDVLTGLAEQYEQTAVKVERSAAARRHPRPAFNWHSDELIGTLARQR